MASAFSFPYFILSLIKKGKTYYNNYRQERHMKKPKQMIVPEAYREAYVNNEADANKKMALLNVVAAAVAIVIWILYLVRFFSVPEIMYPVVYVLFPVAAALLLSPLFFLKSERIRKPRFKNYLIAVFLLVVAAINAVLPKHGVLGWAVAIVMASHYYNPRFARKIYVATIILMLICIYLGMFFGEYDPHLLSLGVVVDGRPATVDTPEARVELLNELIKEGNNRYVYVIPMYYLPRAALISILFIISNALNRRTNKLFIEEIRANTEQEKSKAELNIARRIQMNTLPTEEINTESVEILGEVKAAKEVGGDLYDFLNIDDDHVAILIGDVSGKGVPAAMFMMAQYSTPLIDNPDYEFRPNGMAHIEATPSNGFKTADGYIFTAPAGDKLFPIFCNLIGMPDLPSDPRFNTHQNLIDNRHQNRGVAVSFDGVFVKSFVMPIEAFDILLFVIEDLDDLLTGDHLFDVTVRRTEFDLLLDEVFSRAFCEESRDEENYQRDSDND